MYLWGVDMSDIKCPYCGAYQDVDHDDGYGYEEDKEHEQSCGSCDKAFKFTTSITYCYSVYCENESDHDMYQALPNEPDFFMCKNCEHSELRR